MVKVAKDIRIEMAAQEKTRILNNRIILVNTSAF